MRTHLTRWLPPLSGRYGYEVKVSDLTGRLIETRRVDIGPVERRFDVIAVRTWENNASLVEVRIPRAVAHLWDLCDWWKWVGDQARTMRVSLRWWWRG